MNKVDVKKTVFSKPQYIKTINTTFSELGVTNLSEDIESTVTVEKFFEFYDELCDDDAGIKFGLEGMER